MMPSNFSELHARLIAIASDSAWFMSALRAARQLQLSSWCIGAGAVVYGFAYSLHKSEKSTYNKNYIGG